MHFSVPVLALVLLSACPSTSVYRTADPVPEGKWSVGGGIGVGVISDREQETSIPTGQLEVSARRGVSESLDLGGKLYLAGAEVSATWRVYQKRWSIALAPSFAGVYVRENSLFPESIHVFAGIAGIASRPLSKRWTLAAGPAVGWGLYLPRNGGNAQGLWLGGFVHAQASVWKHWLLGPEITTYAVVAGEVPVKGGAVQLGLGLKREL